MYYNVNIYEASHTYKNRSISHRFTCSSDTLIIHNSFKILEVSP